MSAMEENTIGSTSVGATSPTDVTAAANAQAAVDLESTATLTSESLATTGTPNHFESIPTSASSSSAPAPATKSNIDTSAARSASAAASLATATQPKSNQPPQPNPTAPPSNITSSTPTHPTLPARPPSPQVGFPSQNDNDSDSDIEMDGGDSNTLRYSKDTLPELMRPGLRERTALDRKMLIEARISLQRELGVPVKPKKRPNKSKRRGAKKDKNVQDSAPGTAGGASSSAHGRNSSPVEKPTATILELPFELIAEIMSYLRSSDLLALARTSKSFCHTLVNPGASWLWRRARERCMPEPLPDPNGDFVDKPRRVHGVNGGLQAALVFAAFGIVLGAEAPPDVGDNIPDMFFDAANEGNDPAAEESNDVDTADDAGPADAAQASQEDEKTKRLKERFPRKTWTEWSFAALVLDSGPCSVSFIGFISALYPMFEYHKTTKLSDPCFERCYNIHRLTPLDVDSLELWERDKPFLFLLRSSIPTMRPRKPQYSFAAAFHIDG